MPPLSLCPGGSRDRQKAAPAEFGGLHHSWNGFCWLVALQGWVGHGWFGWAPAAWQS